jgi:hypothetical protein
MNWDGCAIAPEVFSGKFQPYPNRSDYKYPTIVSCVCVRQLRFSLANSTSTMAGTLEWVVAAMMMAD